MTRPTPTSPIRGSVGALVVSVALGLGLGACGDDTTGPVVDPDPTSTTETTAPQTTETTEPRRTTTTTTDTDTTTSSTEAPTLGADDRWVILADGALTTDDGDEIDTVEDVVLGSTVVRRSAEGQLYYLDGEIVRSIGQDSREIIEHRLPERVVTLDVDDDGRVVAMLDDGTSSWWVRVDDREPAEPRTGRAVVGDWSAWVTDPVPENPDAVEFPIERVVVPGAAWFTPAGEDFGSKWEAGGPTAALVSLVDFDGRRIIFARGPYEPALPLWDHFFIDTQCEPDCVVAFRALPGTVALAGPDDLTEYDSHEYRDLNLCETWSPVALKDAPDGLPAEVADGFDDAALAVARCDTWFTSQAGLDIDWADGSAWSALAATLNGPWARDGEVWRWNVTGSDVEIVIDDDGRVTFDLGDEAIESFAVTRTADHLVIAGRVDSTTATELTAAAEDAADRLGVMLIDRIIVDDGAPIEPAVRAALGELIGTAIGLDMAEGRLVEAAHANDILRVWTGSDDGVPLVGELTATALADAAIELVERAETTEVTDLDRDIIENLIAFAAGDDAAGADIPWAPEVTLAAANSPIATLDATEVLDRDNWAIDPGVFRARDGDVSALELLDANAQGDPIVGPHAHCASPPVPAPTALADHRRVSVQATGIDSCIAWTTVDVFIGSDALVHGVSLDMGEP